MDQKFPTVWEKMSENLRGGFFLTHTVDKAGPRPCHFRSGPTSGPTSGPGSQKSKLSVVHRLAFLKGHHECLKWGKTLWQPWLRPGPRWGSIQRSSYPLTGGEGAGCPFPRAPPPLSTLLEACSNLGPSGLTPYLPKSVYQNPTCSELNLF